MSVEEPRRKVGASLRGTKVAALILVFVFMPLVAACGETANSSSEGSGKQRASSGEAEQSSAGNGSGAAASGQSVVEETTMVEGTTEDATSGEAAELARAEVGKKEITNMIPADGKKPDPARPLPKNPPKGIKVYPATTNHTVRGPVEYDRKPPTNGDPIRCGRTVASTRSPSKTGTPSTAWTTG